MTLDLAESRSWIERPDEPEPPLRASEMPDLREPDRDGFATMIAVDLRDKERLK